MKKIIIGTISIICIIILLILFAPLGTKKNLVDIKNSSININIPKLSYVTKNKNNTLEIKSIRSKKSLEKDMSYLNDYENYYCNNTMMYYNDKKNLNITNYNITKKGLISTIKLSYDEGRVPDTDCRRITDYKKLDYIIQKRNTSYKTNYKYLNLDDNKLYNLYYNISDIIYFKDGLDKYDHSIDTLLYSSWISMKTVINYLEYQTENKNITKEIENNNQYIKYYNKDFLIVVCTTENKDIYIENIESINNSFCEQ